jgi:polysaccharide deacetylase 2 family uncharacterized protein YibQ
MNLNRRHLMASLLAAPAILRAAPTRADVMPDFSDIVTGQVTPVPDLVPRWQKFAVPRKRGDRRPMLSIVIDDMGFMHLGTGRAVALPGPLTLSWFPFATNLPTQVAAAAARGHEATLHMPMQAFSDSLYQTGPDPLRIDLPAAENMRRLRAALDGVPQTVGLNNHMGSVATRDIPLMDLVALEAKSRGMLFLDSLVIGHSVAYRQSALIGVPAASRDVFIDDSHDKTVMRHQLAEAVSIAKRYGHVIAIGHPRPATLDVLEAWLPGAEAREGVALTPLSAVVAHRNAIPMAIPPVA